MYAFECLLVLLQIIKASHFLEALNIRTFKNQPWKTDANHAAEMSVSRTTNYFLKSCSDLDIPFVDNH